MQKANQDFQFGLKDVGLTHPDNNAFIRIDESGRIFIMSEPNVGIIIDPAKQSIAFVGDKVNVITKEDEGFKWNNLAFNALATNYAEPTFVYSKDLNTNIYDDIDRYLD